VIDDHSELIVSQLEVEDLPEADLEALRRSGVADPWAEASLSIQRLRRRSAARSTAGVADYEQAVEEARQTLGEPRPAPPKTVAQGRPARRWFKGVGAIVKGGVLISVDGGLLIAGAPITVVEPSASAALIGSLAMGFSDVATGIGDLRGE
jgi:hypothetical protein